MQFVHFLYKNIERALKAYHENEQEKPVELPANAWEHRAGQR